MVFMDRLQIFTLLPLTLAALYAQTPAQPPATAQSPAGLESDWDIAPVIREIGAHAGRIEDALGKIDARAWVEKGASETYAEQVNSAKAQTAAIVTQAHALAAKPEQLALSLELLFRIQGVDTILLSVEEGLRHYDSPRAAQSLAALQAEIGANRARFQTYIVNLAADREHALAIMDKEAQRCRGLIAPQPATAKSGKKK